MKCAAIIGAALVAFTGCSSYRAIPRQEWRPEARYSDVRVATADGFEYRFDRAIMAPDTLIGVYSVTVERTGKNRDEIWYEDLERSHKIPVGQVLRLELVRRDPIKTAFYGATLAAAGYMLATLVDETPRTSTRTGGGGKPPIDPPR